MRAKKCPTVILFGITQQFLGGWELPSRGCLGQRGPLLVPHPTVSQIPAAAPSPVVLCVCVCVCVSRGAVSQRDRWAGFWLLEALQRWGQGPCGPGASCFLRNKLPFGCDCDAADSPIAVFLEVKVDLL